MKQDDPHRYDDILYLPHPEPKHHPRMSLKNRAAIFAPFAALSGYDDAVTETARLTEAQAELSESQKEDLDQKLSLLLDRLEESGRHSDRTSGIVAAGDDSQVRASVTWFKPDSRKDGGQYLTVCGAIRKIDLYRRVIIFSDGKEIRIDDIVEIEEDAD